jgi:hypothetical protein
MFTRCSELVPKLFRCFWAIFECNREATGSHEWRRWYCGWVDSVEACDECALHALSDPKSVDISILYYIIYYSCMPKKTKKPRPEPRPSRSRPRPTSMAQASDFEGRGRKKPSFTGGFQAELSRHITTSHFRRQHMDTSTGVYHHFQHNHLLRGRTGLELSPKYVFFSALLDINYLVYGNHDCRDDERPLLPLFERGARDRVGEGAAGEEDDSRGWSPWYFFLLIFHFFSTNFCLFLIRLRRLLDMPGRIAMSPHHVCCTWA